MGAGDQSEQDSRGLRSGVLSSVRRRLKTLDLTQVIAGFGCMPEVAMACAVVVHVDSYHLDCAPPSSPSARCLAFDDSLARRLGGGWFSDER